MTDQQATDHQTRDHHPGTDSSIPSPEKRYTFAPKLIPTLAAIVTLAALVSLGIWQIYRHFERNAHVEVMRKNQGLEALSVLPTPQEVPQHVYRRFKLSGHYIGDHLLEAGRALKYSSGYAVFQVFEVEGGARLLVDRGDAEREGIQKTLAALPDKETIEGQLRPILGHEKGSPVNPESAPLIWRHQSIDQIHHWATQALDSSSTQLLPGVYLRVGAEYVHKKRPKRPHGQLLQTGYLEARMNWDSAHYAVQWFGIAAIIFGFWLWASFGKPWSTY